MARNNCVLGCPLFKASFYRSAVCLEANVSTVKQKWLLQQKLFPYSSYPFRGSFRRSGVGNTTYRGISPGAESVVALRPSGRRTFHFLNHFRLSFSPIPRLESLLLQSINRKTEAKKISISLSSQNPMSCKYIGSFEFVGRSFPPQMRSLAVTDCSHL